MKNSGRTINRWTRWLVSVAMLVNLVIPLSQGMAAAAFAGGSDNGMPPLVICGAMGGIVRVSEDGNSKVPHNLPAPCSCAFCLYCQTTCQKVITPSLLTITLPRVIATIYRQRADYVGVSASSPGRHRQRAPPSFS